MTAKAVSATKKVSNWSTAPPIVSGSLVRHSLFFTICRFTCFKGRSQLFLLPLERFFAFVDKAAEIIANFPPGIIDVLPAFRNLVGEKVATVRCSSSNQLSSLASGLRSKQQCQYSTYAGASHQPQEFVASTRFSHDAQPPFLRSIWIVAHGMPEKRVQPV